MKKLLMWALIFSFANLGHARPPSTYQQLKNQLGVVTQKNLLEWVTELVRVSAPTRMVGQSGHTRAVEFLKKVILELDTKKTGTLVVNSTTANIDSIKEFYQKDFNQKVEGKFSPKGPDYQRWLKFTQSMQQLVQSKKDIPVQNIVWEKSGLNSDKVLVISAHFDTISHDKDTLLVREQDPMPGANYNASGVAVALGLIKLLSQMELNYSVKVVFLDWQGLGYHGSQLFSQELKKSGKIILGVINLEMLGQDTSFFDKTKKLGNMCVYSRNQLNEMNWIKKLLLHGSKMTDKISFDLRPNAFENSDNFRFWDEGMLAATFSQNWEDDFNPKFYHTPLDSPETLNYSTLYEAYRFIAGAAVGILLDLTQ